MPNIERLGGADGSIEKYGATAAITDQLTVNYQQRGTQAAGLVVATLTETPFTPEIDGQTFGITISNRYKGAGEGEATDTVIEAKELLAEMIGARVPGSSRVSLDTYRTDYRSIWSRVKPGLRAPDRYHRAFDEALVEELRSQGVAVAEPEQAQKIIHQAPKKLAVLRLSDVSSSPGTEMSYDAVTAEGHMLRVCSFRSYGGIATRHYLSSDIHKRGGTAPRPYDLTRIKERVVHLRTAGTRR